VIGLDDLGVFGYSLGLDHKSAYVFCVDAAARRRVEPLAIKAVRHAEEARHCCVVRVSVAKCGPDRTSYSPAIDGKQPDSPHIEVKARVKSAVSLIAGPALAAIRCSVHSNLGV